MCDEFYVRAVSEDVFVVWDADARVEKPLARNEVEFLYDVLSYGVQSIDDAELEVSVFGSE